MPDREKVVKGLYQHCEGSMFDRCGECPYYEVADEPFRCRDALLMDVLALLREQSSDKDTNVLGKWISVKDRMPEEHADENLYEFEQFLCATVWDNVRMVGFGTRIGDDKPHFWSGNSIWDNWDNWVTHWQPLPKPPEEVANGEPD